MIMSFLYEKIATLKEAGMSAVVPQFLIDNLSDNIVLREYQKEAIYDTILYFDTLGKNKQTHLLYHMATGSGKTVIMAMNILYYYNLGYRNFLFFTNQTNIISKTKINFLEKTSSKYLFSDVISIGGANIRVNEVSNFEDADKNAINICFNTVQGIHSSLSLVREGSLTIEDFENEKIVLIADEAHHLNSTTSKDKEENAANATWEDTVNRIFYANKDNVLLEYTATCDVRDKNVRSKYLDKIIYNFDLKEFRKAGYTKEFANLSSNTSRWGRTLQALIISEYRKLIFEEHKISIKPVVLLKSKTIVESKRFYEEFYEKLKLLEPDEIESIRLANTSNDIFNNAFSFFSSIHLSHDNLVDLIKADFAEENSVNMNSLNPENEKIVNNLDEKDNHYRLIFIVDKLTEGWDVLSLFDIVRLYETRQGGPKGSVSKYTISEAQLIGRGARYCPFQFTRDQVREKRKYSDYKNPLSICETLLYHCMDNSKYIDEIKRALKQTGLLPATEPIPVTYKLKESFKKTKTYMRGYVFLNERKEVNRSAVTSLSPKIRTMGRVYKCKTYSSAMGLLLEDKKTGKMGSGLKFKDLNPIRFGDIQYSIIYKAYRCFDQTLAFDKLKKQFPNLESVKSFLTDDDYLGSFPITFVVIEGETPSVNDKLNACKEVLQIISDYVQNIEVSYEGTTEFYPKLIHEMFTDRVRNVTRAAEDESWGEGISQNDALVDSNYRMSLADRDWYAYNDNFGTSEEKKFVKYFSTIVDDLQKKFQTVFLIRNELQVSIYSFDDGAAFMPDYVLILNKELEQKTADGKDNIYICVFVEPKGEHLLPKDNWKNALLLDLVKKGVPIVKLKDDNEYRIWGTPLYNESATKSDFITYFTNLINSIR